jgi:hypothetical protein
MKPTTMARWSMALVVAALAAGCGRDADQVRAEHAAHSKSRASADQAAGAAAAAAEADFVSAVSSASSASPVALKFRMQEPPRVGQPLQLELVLSQLPGVDISSMLVSFQPGDGLQLQSDHSFEFRAPVAGATQRMSVTLLPNQAGVLSLGATVLVDSANTSVARYFLIPLIAVPPAS